MGMMFQDPNEMYKKNMEDFAKVVRSLLGVMKDRDKRLHGILNGLPPPFDLLKARQVFRLKLRLAVSERYKILLAQIIKILNDLIDLYAVDPLFVATPWSDSSSSTRLKQEMVIGAPGLDVYDAPPEDEILQKYGQSTKDDDFDLREEIEPSLLSEIKGGGLPSIDYSVLDDDDDYE